MAPKPSPPRGLGRTSRPDSAGQDTPEAGLELPPPLAEPVFVDDVVMLEFFQRYNLLPFAPPSKFEYQLVCIAAGLEQRIRELDPDL